MNNVVKTLIILAIGLAIGIGGTWIIIVRPADQRAKQLIAQSEQTAADLRGQLDRSVADVSSLTDKLSSAQQELRSTVAALQRADANLGKLQSDYSAVTGQLVKLRDLLSGAQQQAQSDDVTLQRLTSLIRSSLATVQQLQKADGSSDKGPSH